MKYESKRPSGVDKDVMVYQFTMGGAEMCVLAQTLAWVEKNTPPTIDTQSFRHRLLSVSKELARVMRLEGIKPQVFKHDFNNRV